MLRGFPRADWDEHDRLVGRGLTLRPAPTRFVVDGRALFTWRHGDPRPPGPDGVALFAGVAVGTSVSGIYVEYRCRLHIGMQLED